MTASTRQELVTSFEKNIGAVGGEGIVNLVECEEVRLAKSIAHAWNQIKISIYLESRVLLRNTILDCMYLFEFVTGHFEMF